MNRTKRMIGFGLLVATCAIAAAATISAITLKATPKEGDDAKYKMSGHFQVMGTDASLTADVDYKVTKVDKDGNTTVEATTKNMEIEVNGQTISPDPAVATRVSKPNGEVTDFKADVEDPNGWRMAILNNFIYPEKPVDVGDTWTWSTAGDSKKGTVALSETYKFDSLEKVGTHDTAKIKVSFKETEGSDPATKDGFVWIDVKDGSFVKSDSTWTNLPTPQGPLQATITMTKVD
jgi:hypothetical protein